MGKILDFFIDALSKGTRPIRIFFFGGVFLALFISFVLSQFLGINTKIGGDINIENIVLIIVSLFIGFGVSYSFIQLVETIKRKRRPDARSH